MNNLTPILPHEKKKTLLMWRKKWRMENKLCWLKSELKLILLTCNMHVKTIIFRNELYESKYHIFTITVTNRIYCQ